MAAIFVSDYNKNYTQLAEYLTYLSTNETAYELHREWRKNYTYENHIKNKPLLESSWHCRVCQWVIDNTNNISHIKADKKCIEVKKTQSFYDNISDFEGRLINVRPNKHFAYYIVVDKTLRAVPDVHTLEFFQMEADDAIIITHEEMKKCTLGRPFKSFQF